MTQFSRRAFMALGAAAAAAAAASPAFAGTAEAERRLQSLFNAMTEAVKLPPAARTARFEKILTDYGDMRSIAHNALGRERRSLSAAQITEFTGVFKTYMAKKYGRLLAKQRISGLTIEGAELKHDRRGTAYYELDAQVQRSGKAAVRAEFKLNGNYRFFNMAIEGVNMLLSERREVGNIFDSEPHFNAVLDALRRA